jgi:methyl-accepting chemotaxis protein
MFRRISNWPIAVRLHLCTLVAVMGLLALAAYEIPGRATQMEADCIRLLRAVVDTAIASAARLEAEERAGRMDRPAAQAAAAEAIRGTRYSGQEYLWVNDTQARTRMVVHPFRRDLEGKDVSELRDPTGFALFSAFAEQVRRSGSGVVSYLWPRPGAAAGEPPVEKLSYVQGFGPWGWVIGTGVYVDDLRQAQHRLYLHGMLIAGFAAAVVGLLTWKVGRGITRPLAAATAATSAMAEGDLEVPVPGAGRRDELGLLAGALETFRENGLKARRLEEAQAADAARAAVSRAEATDATVRGLSEAAGQVGEVVRLIAGIAEQTNLLALNATIEAARAGEAGKGFAVVASEVKQLAAQTAKATEQITTQVAAIQKATVEAVQAVREVGEAIGRMDEVAAAIAAAVEEQGAATQEIASSVQTVARRNDETTRSMRNVSQVAQDAGGASRSVLGAAEEVAQVSGTLREEVDGFLAAMRADESERRHYERIPGHGARAVLRQKKGPELPAGVRDVSRGGISLVCDMRLEPGTEVEVVLLGFGGPLPGRVARVEAGLLAVIFRQDRLTATQAGQVFEAIKAGAGRSLAA